MESESPNAEVSIRYENPRTGTRVSVIVEFPDGSRVNDRFDAASRVSLQRFLKRLVKGRDGLDPGALEAELEAVASHVVDRASAQRERGKETTRKQADLILDIASEAILFHSYGGYDAEAYATITVDGRCETWPVGEKGYRFWLAKRFRDQHGSVPSSQSIQDAIGVITGIAIHDGMAHDVFVRVGEFGGCYFLDLCDEDWRVVEIDCDGWRVIESSKCPVRFIRPRGAKPLPVPRRGGDLDALWRLVNLPDEQSRVLYSACLVAWLRPVGPYPILVVDGEHGSAKSTLCRITIDLIDPKVAGLRRPPRDEHDLMIAAAHSQLIAYDNLSGIRADLSDAICSLATGGGFATRELYSDSSEKHFEAMRPVLLNGIANVGTRSDLLDRSVSLHLGAIAPNKRREDRVIREEFDEQMPLILGVLLDALSSGIAQQSKVVLPELPRMADFARFATAAERGLGWEPGAFMAAYGANRDDVHGDATAASPIGCTLKSFLKDAISWEGTAAELLAELNSAAGEGRTRPDGWPKSSRALSEALRRIGANLRAIGYEVSFLPRSRTRRLISLRRPCCDGRTHGGDGSCDDNRHHETGSRGVESALRDGGDGGDDDLRLRSSTSTSTTSQGGVSRRGEGSE